LVEQRRSRPHPDGERRGANCETIMTQPGCLHDAVDTALRLFFQYGTEAASVAADRLARARIDGSKEEIREWDAVLAAIEGTCQCDAGREKMLACWRRLSRHRDLRGSPLATRAAAGFATAA
jgi:hypothetical protein